MKAALSLMVLLLAATGAISQSAPAAKPSPTPFPTKIGKEVKRWVDLDTFTLTTRYRYVRANSGAELASQQQYQAVIKGHFSFDRKAKYRAVFLAQTGNTFNGGFNTWGAGTGKFQSNFYVKQLYFDARPAKEVELQVGGIDINRGENTEITTYDNDGYLTGERVTIRAPKHVFFDEISATSGYLGDLLHPSVFPRLKHHLDKSNYHQFLVRKQATKHVGVSADYTFESGRDTLHEAIRVKNPKRLWFDTLLWENYQRLSPQRDIGLHLFAEKVVNKRFSFNGGFARIDRRLTLNGDRFPPGKRLYISGAYKLTPTLTLSSILIQGVGRLPTALSPRTRFEILLTWNVLEELKRHHIL